MAGHWQGLGMEGIVYIYMGCWGGLLFISPGLSRWRFFVHSEICCRKGDKACRSILVTMIMFIKARLGDINRDGMVCLRLSVEQAGHFSGGGLWSDGLPGGV